MNRNSFACRVLLTCHEIDDEVLSFSDVYSLALAGTRPSRYQLGRKHLNFDREVLRLRAFSTQSAYSLDFP